MKKQGFIFILSGPSGSGKTTLSEKLLGAFKKSGVFSRSVSYTTRPPRAGEIDGSDYHFITADAFFRLRRDKKFLEWTSYLGYYYATSRAFVENELNRGRHIVLCLDFRGVRQLKKEFGDRAVSIFIVPPSLEELRTRISRRCRMHASEIDKRVTKAQEELSGADKYDYSIVNKDLESAAVLLKDLVTRILKIK